jgi:hypothetical protein
MGHFLCLFCFHVSRPVLHRAEFLAPEALGLGTRKNCNLDFNFYFIFEVARVPPGRGRGPEEKKSIYMHVCLSCEAAWP